MGKFLRQAQVKLTKLTLVIRYSVALLVSSFVIRLGFPLTIIRIPVLNVGRASPASGGTIMSGRMPDLQMKP